MKPKHSFVHIAVVFLCLWFSQRSIAQVPQVVWRAPATHAQHVAAQSSISVRFSTSMNVASLTSANIRVYGVQTGLRSTSASAYASNTNTVSLTPASAFRSGERVYVSVTTGVQSSAGTNATRATVWSFTVAAPYGAGNFANAWTQSTGTTDTYRIVSGDFDGDGDLDVFEGNYGQPNKVWQNDGNGNFTNTWTQSTGAVLTTCVATGDFDGDGDLDIMEGAGFQENKVWLNDGSGNFTNTWTQSSGVTNTASLAIGDLDGDGDLDTFEGSYSNESGKVWLNDGNGNFTNTWTQGGGMTNTICVVLGDVDNDGDLDVLEGNYNNQGNKLWKNDGSGNFTNTWTQSSGETSTVGLALGDFDGDGNVDVFEGSYGQPNKMWLNDGSGVFTATWLQGGTANSTICVTAGDFDGDGDLDVFEGNYEQGNTLWQNDGSGVFAATWTQGSGAAKTSDIAVGDFTGDGTLDVYEGNYDSQANVLWSQMPAPVVRTVQPSTNALHVVRSTAVSISFDRAMDASTLTGDNIRIHGAQTGLRSTSASAYNSATHAIALTPTLPYKPGEIVTVSVTTGAQSTSGVRAARATVWSFVAAVQGGTGELQAAWTQSSGVTQSLSVATGDLDGDGDLDVFEGNFYGQANRVWLNDGSGNFTNTWTQISGNTSTTHVALGDLDGDGDLDVFESNWNAEENKVWQNDGSGNFTNTWTQSSGGYTSSAALSDLDGDGDLDVFEGNHDEPNRVWLNDGNGNFTNAWTQSSAATYTRSIAVADMDNDGDMDVFEGNQAQPNKVWLNDGNGNFANTWTQSTGTTNTWDVATADVNGDGFMDIVEGNAGDANKVWLNDGSGNFASAWVQSTAAATTWSIALGDMDGDGDIDIVEGNYGEPNKVWQNDGSGAFTTLWVENGSSTTASITLGDFDGDGDMDVFEGNHNNEANKLWRNQVLEAPRIISYAPATNALHVAPTADIRVQCSTSMNVGTLTSANIRIHGAQTGMRSTSALVYNGATNTVVLSPFMAFKPGEIVAVSVTTGVQSSAGVHATQATVWSFVAAAQGGNGVLTNTWTQDADAAATESLAIGDLDGDGDLDVFEGNALNQMNRVWQNDGSGNFTNTWTQSSNGTNTRVVALGDLDGDGDLDVFEGNVGNARNKVWKNDGSGNFVSAWEQSGIGSNTWTIVLGDLDGDGDLDAFEGNYSNQANRVWQNDGSGNFTNTWMQSLDMTNTTSIAVGDLDGDGDLDMFEGNYGTANKAWLNDGSGNFTNTWTQSANNTSTRSIALGDLNGDGTLDVFEGNELGQSKAWLNNGFAWFAPTWTQSSAASATRTIALGDLDGDGDLDAVEGNFNEDNRVWLNSGTGLFAEVALQGANKTNGIALGDMDGDGDLDAVEGNGSSSEWNKLWENGIPALVVRSVVGVPVLSGEEFAITVQAQEYNGTPFVVQTTTAVVLAQQHASLVWASGSTRAAIPAGQSSTTFTVSLYNTSTGSATTLAQVSAEQALFTSTQAVLTIGANQPPTIVADAPTHVLLVSSSTSISVRIGDVETPVSNLRLTSASDNINLLPDAGVVQSGATSATTVWTLTPALNTTGTASVVITVHDGVYSVSTVVSITVTTGNTAPFAVDDAMTICADSPLVLAPMANDSDTDNDALTIVGITQPAHGVAVVLAGDTALSYTPNTAYVGGDVFTYTISDGRGGSSTATVYVDVHALAIDISVLLEGVYTGSTLATYLQYQGLVPVQQPYNTAPFNYTGSETITSIPDSSIVDWVLLELRAQPLAGSAVMRRAVLLRKDGKLVDVDGVSAVTMATIGTTTGSVYAVVYHRNHIPVMSAAPIAVVNCSVSYDFAFAQSQAYSQFASGQKSFGSSAFGLFGGDISGDGIVNAIDRVASRNNSGLLGYLTADVSLDGIVNAVDRVLVRNNTFVVSQVP